METRQPLTVRSGARAAASSRTSTPTSANRSVPRPSARTSLPPSPAWPCWSRSVRPADHWPDRPVCPDGRFRLRRPRRPPRVGRGPPRALRTAGAQVGARQGPDGGCV